MSLPLASPRVPGVRALFALLAARTVLTPLYSAASPWLKDQLEALPERQRVGALSLPWLALAAVELVALSFFWSGQKETAAATPAWVSLVLACLLVALDLTTTLALLGLPSLLPAQNEALLGGALIRIVLGGLRAVAFWLALSRALGAVPAWVGPTFLCLEAVRDGLSLFRILNLERALSLTRDGGLIASALRLAPSALSVLGNGILLWMLWRLIKAGAEGAVRGAR